MSTYTPTASITAKLPASQKIGYVFADISCSITFVMSSIVLYFATENLALSAAGVSLMIMLVKIFDGFTDVVAGVIIDKTKSKAGKARPWFLWMAVPYPLCLTLTFFVPAAWSPVMKLIALTVMYALTISIFGTMVGVSRSALIPRMTLNQIERGKLATFGETSGIIMASLSMTIINIFLNSLGRSSGVYRGIFVCGGIIYFIFCLVGYLMVREIPREALDRALKDRKEQAATIKECLRTLVKNKYAFLILVYIGLTQLALSVGQSSGFFYWYEFIGNGNGMTVGGFLGIAFMLVAMPFGSMLMAKIGKKRMVIVGSLVAAAISCIVYFFLHNWLTIAIVRSVVGIFSMMFPCSATAAMIADSIEYGEFKTGIRAEGSTSAALNVGTKIGTGFGAGLFGLVVAFGGYVSGAQQQTEQAINSINFAAIMLPAIIFVILAIFVALTYDLDKKYPAIIKELEARRAKGK